MNLPSGTWRMDIYVMVLYQMLLFFSAQMIFVIILEYMPSTYCNDVDYCYKMKGPCIKDYDKTLPNLCDANSGNFKACVEDKKTVHFKSPAFDYEQGCTDLRYFSMTTSQYLGVLAGNAVLGYASDRFGRRKIIIVALTVGLPALVLSAAIPGVGPFYFFRTILGFAIAGTLTVGWSYGSELITVRQRFRLRAIPNWANARIMQTFLAWLSGEWRIASYLCAAFATILVPMLYYLPESPTFLRQKGRFEESEAARMRIAEICDVEFVPGKEEEVRALETIGIRQLLMRGELRRSFLVLCVMWFYVGMVVYVTDLNGGDMSKDFWVGQFLSGIVLSVSKTALGLLDPYMPWMGRRTLFFSSQLIAIVCYVLIIAFLYLDQKGTSVYTGIYVIAYASQSITLETCYLALAELMPTDVRSTAGAITNLLMKVGTILATTLKPLKHIHEPALYWVNLTVSLIGVVIVYYNLDETRGCNLELVGQKSAGPSSSKSQSENEAAMQLTQTSRESKLAEPSASNREENKQ